MTRMSRLYIIPLNPKDMSVGLFVGIFVWLQLVVEL